MWFMSDSLLCAIYCSTGIDVLNLVVLSMLMETRNLQHEDHPSCLNVTLSISTHQCQVNTAPSQINMLVPGFQEPPTADLLLELISIHKINVLFI